MCGMSFARNSPLLNTKKENRTVQKEVNEMKKRDPWVKLVGTMVAIVFSLQLVSCGYLLYPERRGQTHGRIDPAIAVLDGVGLLLFIVPGIVAFAVDFATGTIYLPGSKRASKTSPKTDKMTVIHVNPSELDISKIEDLVTEHTKYSLRFDQENLRVFEWDGVENLEAELLRLAEFWKNAPLKDMVAHQKNF